MFTAHTTEDGITTNHATLELAKAAVVDRTGPGEWVFQSLPYGDVWTQGEDRDLYAVVFPIDLHERVIDDFGLFID